VSVPVLERAKWDALRRGLVIPAHPLALTAERRLDERHQRALSRYYLASGAGGLAVAVHTTQFAIREPRFGLHRPVLELAAEVAWEQSRPGGPDAGRPIVLVAGVVGRTEQALAEATLARDLGYDAVLLQLGAFGDATDDELVAHCERVAEVLPLFGFYLQPAVGGRRLGRDFWRRFAAIPNVVAIKVAPFDRYATLDVMLGVAESGRGREVALYTGNDDAIMADLLLSLETTDATGEALTLRFVGGLLGHWAVWTRKAVDTLARVHEATDRAGPPPLDLLELAWRTTDANAALFDPGHGFAGCIPGIHEILRRQGLLAGRWTLDHEEDLSPGQLAEIDRVCAAYPELTDDDFVTANLQQWLA
jgi:dihydrodipicolinate synthase/N-acetylneuraminate lyase